MYVKRYTCASWKTQTIEYPGLELGFLVKVRIRFQLCILSSEASQHGQYLIPIENSTHKLFLQSESDTIQEPAFRFWVVSSRYFVHQPCYLFFGQISSILEAEDLQKKWKWYVMFDVFFRTSSLVALWQLTDTYELTDKRKHQWQITITYYQFITYHYHRITCNISEVQ